MTTLKEIGERYIKAKKKRKKIKNQEKVYRLKRLGELQIEEGKLNEVALALIRHYLKLTKEAGRSSLYFNIPMLPKSANAQYEATYNPKTGQRGRRLCDEILTLREMTKVAMHQLKAGWTHEKTGTQAIVILFESPLWLTLKNEIREKDGDNLIKPMVDAVKVATNNPDSKIFHYHVFKVQSKQTRTWVFLFDLGDIIETHS